MKARIPMMIMAAVLPLCGCEEPAAGIYTGTYGDAIHYVVRDAKTGQWSGEALSEAHNASWVEAGGTNAAGQKVIYAVREDGDASALLSFVETAPGQLTTTACLAQTGSDPCHILVIPDRQMVCTADYGGGSISVFKTVDGVLTELTQTVQYKREAPATARQKQANVHQLRLLPESIESGTGICGQWLLASDLGCDAIHLLEVQDGSLVERKDLDVFCGSGSGPRHMEFNEPLGILYLLTELSGEVIAYRIAANDSGEPTLSELQRIKGDEVDAGGSADIHLSADGKFLYTSHRLEHEGISVFSVDEDGILEKVGYTLTKGHPRHFCFTPDGSGLLVACRDGNCIQTFDIDAETGLLTERPDLEFTLCADLPVRILMP